jgi:hypothetical protein
MKPFDFTKYILNNPLLKESKQLNEMRAQETVVTSANKLKSVLGGETLQSELGPAFDWQSIDPSLRLKAPFKDVYFQIVPKGEVESDDEELGWYIYAAYSYRNTTHSANVRAAENIKDFILSKS